MFLFNIRICRIFFFDDNFFISLSYQFLFLFARHMLSAILLVDIKDPNFKGFNM